MPAIQMYRNALRKFYDNRSAIVMLYLARCVRQPGAGAAYHRSQPLFDTAGCSASSP